MIALILWLATGPIEIARPATWAACDAAMLALEHAGAEATCHLTYAPTNSPRPRKRPRRFS